MKVSITTFFDHTNYGAVLQAYALQRKIESFGDEACHISFASSQDASEDVSDCPVSPLLKTIRSHTDMRKANFKAFREKYLHISPFSDELVSGTDVFITGSDQVFNTSLPGWTDRFLLTFAKDKRRTSYAASFGDAVKNEGMFIEELQHFDNLSMREESAVRTAARLSGKEVSRVVDPVFLLDKEEWSAIADTSEFHAEKPYLLFIMVQNNQYFGKFLPLNI